MPSIKVGDTYIQTGEFMKYLGVLIDSTWRFRFHFSYIEKKLNKMTRVLSRLMPNLRGPSERKRQFYATILTSVFTYAAPVWTSALSSSPKKIIRPLRRLQRTIAICVVSAYRTVSFDAATLLARMPSWTLEASLRRRVYDRIKELRSIDAYNDKEDETIRKEESVLLFRQWELFLRRPGAWGQRTINAILPHMNRWIARKHGGLSYHSTQMITGHGSFGHFLWRLGKKETPGCNHCADEDDTSEHTLKSCPAWNESRDRLLQRLEVKRPVNVTLDFIINIILVKEFYWLSFDEFCTRILVAKEEEERIRERGRISALLSTASPIDGSS